MLATLPAWSSITTDVSVSADLSAAATQVTTPSFSTSSGNELLLALVASDSQSSPMTVTAITGGGLTWVPVARVNATRGTSEIWRAFAVSPLSNVSVTANLAEKVFASIQVISFSGVDTSGSNGSGAIGAVATASGSGTPSVALTTTRANSLVLGVGNDYDNAIARSLGSGQTLIHQNLSSPNNDTYWMQRLTNVVAASGTKVTINDTAPKGDHFNLAICEILAPSGTAAPSISSLSSISGAAGASIVIAGSGFGASRGNGGVTFNGTAATISSWSSTSITAVVPYGATTGNVVVAAGDGISSNGAAFTVTPGAGLAIDASSVGDLAVAGTQLSTASFSTSAGNELLLAFIATDATSAGMTVSAVSGGGLSWTLVKRANAQLGDAEVWRAFATSPLSNVSVTATLSQSVVASIQVLSFIGADASGSNGSGAIGAVGSGNANPGAPSANLVTTRANSWVFGVGNDYDKSISREMGSGQTLLNQYWSPSNDTYWMQRQNNTTPASGTTVTINDTAPATDRYNLAIVEVLPANTPPPFVSSLAPGAGQVGDVVTINGSSFGATQGASTLTFGGITATPSSWTTSQILVPVPAGVAVGTVSVVVTTAGGASNSAGFTVVPPLAIAAFASPAPNAAGWNNSNVTITYSCTGGVAPVVCPPAVTIATEGANQVISATASDAVGNAATATVTLKIDKTSPTITAKVTPAPSPAGVVNTPATITFTCFDATSGVATCPAPISVTTPGANQSFNGRATDVAGNVSAPATVTLNVESAPLAVSASASPASNANGWNNSDVTVTFACTGGVPPVVCPAQRTVNTDGANQLVSGTATDAAGQTASGSVILNVDETGPTISATILPAPNVGGVATLPATVSFTCFDATSGVATCPSPIAVTSVGLNQTFTGTATDKAGNTTTTNVFVNAQAASLAIVASALPPPNPAGWNNTTVTISYTCSGGVPPLQCPPSQTVSTDGANQVVTASASDAVGQTASTAVTLQIDTTPPLVSITSPQGNIANSGPVVVQGVVSDALSGLASVNCNGAAATVSGSAFTCNVTFTQGSNTVAVTASDVAGNSATATLTQSVSFPINVQITSPTPLQLFSANPITVTGTVDAPNATVTVGGVTGSASNGTFTVSGVILREDKNLLTVGATTPAGGVGSATVTVYLDTNAPVVHIDGPADGSSVTTAQIDVVGNVNDLVTGTVNGAQVSITVNGVTANVANRSFAAHGVLLVPGANTVTAIAADRAGNTGQHQIHVNLAQVAGQQTLTAISGTGQRGAIGTLLPPLVVRATDALGRPMPNVALNFAVAKSDGIIISGQNQGRTLVVQTDANGNASVQFQLGSRNGAGINQVAVTAAGFGQATFTADSTVGSPTLIHPVSGEMQKGALGAALPEPLSAIVFDAGGNPVPNVPVTFTVVSGSGLIGGQTTFTQNTDNDGKVSAVLVLGQQPGINNNEVDASFTGMSGQPAVFMSSSVTVGPVANTTISGIVLDDADQPIPNATASVKGTNFIALTDADGRFTIANAPIGDIVLFVDGSTSTAPERYPTLSFQMATLPGIDNTLPGPIFLPEIDATNSQVVGGDQDVVLTMKGVPGVAYKVFAHSVTFPDGSRQGALTLSQVHADKVPMTPPNGTAPRLVGTLQPAGVKFDPPIQITLPNTDGLAPGQVMEIFSFHHDVEQFVTEGTARVSEDGSVVVSDPGFGLSVSGWHGGIVRAPASGGAGGGGCSDSSDPLSVTAKADGKTEDFKFVGDTIAFTATPKGQCNGATWDWDFNDKSQHSTIQNPSHPYSQPQMYKVKVHLSCTTSCPKPRAADATVSATAIKLTPKAVNWTGSGQNQMKKTGSGAWDSGTFASDGDTNIVNPVWKAQDDGTVTTNDPVSYVKGNKPSLTVTFKVEPSLTSAVPAVLKPSGDLAGSAGAGTLSFNNANFSLQGSSTDSPSMTSTNAISAVVDDVPTTMHWSVSLDGGNNFKEVGTSKHRAFITWGTPAGYYANTGVTAMRVQHTISINAGLTNVTDMAKGTANALEAFPGFDLGDRHRNTFVDDTRGNHWALLDNGGKAADCISLAVLAVKHLKMLGIPSAKEGRAYPTGGNPPGDTDATGPETDARGRVLDFFAAGDPDHPNPVTGVIDVGGDNSFEGFFEVTDGTTREAFTVDPTEGPTLEFSGAVSGDKLFYNVIKTTLDGIKAGFRNDLHHPHDGRQYWSGGTGFDFSHEVPFPVPH